MESAPYRDEHTTIPQSCIDLCRLFPTPKSDAEAGRLFHQESFFRRPGCLFGSPGGLIVRHPKQPARMASRRSHRLLFGSRVPKPVRSFSLSFRSLGISSNLPGMSQECFSREKNNTSHDSCQMPMAPKFTFSFQGGGWSPEPHPLVQGCRSPDDHHPTNFWAFGGRFRK